MEGTHAVEVLKQIETDSQIAKSQNSLPAHDRILDLAISQGAPLEKLEKWMELKIKYEENEAKKAFYEALATFHQESIVITKDKVNPQFKSSYSSLGNLLHIVNPYLGKHGLSVRFVPKQNEKMIFVECVLQHQMGHTESVEMHAPPDTSGGNSKNPIQQIKSTFTYLRSATFEAVTGLSGTEASFDDDGNSSGIVEYIAGDDLEKIKTILKETSSDEKIFLKFAEAESLDEIPLKNLKKITTALNKKKTRQPGEEG